jgi:hypothetical protein
LQAGSPHLSRSGSTGRENFINLFNYWLKIFVVTFGVNEVIE